MKGSSSSKVIGIVVVVAIIAVAAILGWTKISGTAVTPANLNKDSYYAVFLSNDQVYFGHLDDVNSQYVDLTDVYYLQLSQDLQQAAAADDKSKVSLVKLGSEMHGPKDNMKINRDQVLFYEELKDDSKVVQSIVKGSNIGQ